MRRGCSQQTRDEEEDRELGYQTANPDLLADALVDHQQQLDGNALGFTMGGGGFMLPYHLGAIKSLLRLGLARPGKTKVGGTSAGSLAATVLALGLDVDAVLPTVRAMMADMRENGVFKRLGPLMRETVSAHGHAA